MKMTKKFISVVLAVIMVVSMLPITVFGATTHSKNDQVALDAQAAITAYETKMNGTVYKNMLPAYEAYLKVVKAYNVYVYGDVDTSPSLSSLVSDLNTKTTAMTADGIYNWNNYTGISSVVPTFSASSKTLDSMNNGGKTFYANILYQSGVSGTRGSSTSDNATGYVANLEMNKCRVCLYYSTNTVVLVDGKKTPQIPVMFSLNPTGGSDRYVYAVYPTDSVGSNTQNGDIYMINKNNRKGDTSWDWKGGGAARSNAGKIFTADFSYAIETSAANAYVGQDYELTNGRYSDQVCTGGTKGDYRRIHYYASSMEVNPSMNFGTTSNGIKTITNLPWRAFAGSDKSPKTTDVNGSAASSSNIYVLNLRDMLALYPDAISRAQTYSTNIANYRSDVEGYSLSGFFAGLDAVTSLTPSDFTNLSSSTNVAADAAAVGAKLTTAIQNLPKTGGTVPGTGYAELRKQMELRRATYNATDVSRFDATSYAGFESLYDECKQFMADSWTAGYHDDQAMALAIRLRDYVIDLNFTPANVATLIALIDDATLALNNDHMFTNDLTSLQSLVSQAIAAVWHNGDGVYKDEGSVCDQSEQNIVDQWVTTIFNALIPLTIDKDEVVGTAWGHSMNSAIAEAGNYNPADYSNYNDVSAAVQAAQNFDIRVVSATTDTSNFSAGLVAAKISEYNELTRDIMVAINNLKAAFSKMPDGQVARFTQQVASFTAGSDKGHETSVAYSYPTDVVIFRTKHSAKTLELPLSQIGFNANPSENKLGSSYMDSLNINSQLEQDAHEISSNYDNNDHSMSNPSDYQGGLEKSATVNGTTYTLKVGYNSAIQGSGIYGAAMTEAGFYGYDLTGESVTSSTFDWTDSLKNTNGTSSGAKGPNGSIVALRGMTILNATTSMNVPAKNISRPAMTTVPIADNQSVSAVVRWSASGVFARVYYGYTANFAKYTQTIYVIDIAGLIDVMNEAEELQRANYTTTSWNAFQQALSDAKSNLAYDTLDASTTLARVQERYDNLVEKMQIGPGGLVEAANNNKVDEALEAALAIKTAVDNGEARYSTSTYNTFLTARQAALDAVNGEYSDANCRDVARDETSQHNAQMTNQQYINSIGQALLDAIAALASFADFTNLNNALDTVIANDTYTVETLNAFKAYISTLTYANMTEAEKAEVEADFQSAVDSEATAIRNKINQLVASDAADKTAFVAAARTILDADPDAYSNIEACQAIIDEYQANSYAKLLYETVNVLGKNVRALKTQAQVDAVTASALSFTLQNYDIFVDGNKYGTYSFGDEAEVTFGKNCAIYYAYTSNTATNTAKYYTTDSIIRFIVKGDTYLTTKAAEGEASAKVKFVNGLKNKVYETDYVVKGGTITLPTAPSVAYYNFTGYTVNGVDYAVGDTVTITKATTSVVANYEYANDENSFDITIYYDTNGYGTMKNIFGPALYNDRVDITQDGLMNYVKDKGKNYFGAKFVIEGDEIMKPSSNEAQYKSSSSDDIIAYATVDASIEEDFSDLFGDFVIEDETNGDISYSEACADYAGALNIVSYGADYSFFASGTTPIFALTQENYDYAVEAGLIEVDENGADVSVKEDLVDADTKWSIVGTYGIPEGATLVENGVLFTKNNSTLKMSDVDGSNVYRFKSSQHTVGNQFVISIKKPSAATPVKYLTYTIYELGGKQYTVFSNPVTTTMNNA